MMTQQEMFLIPFNILIINDNDACDQKKFGPADFDLQENSEA